MASREFFLASSAARLLDSARRLTVVDGFIMGGTESQERRSEDSEGTILSSRPLHCDCDSPALSGAWVVGVDMPDSSWQGATGCGRFSTV